MTARSSVPVVRSSARPASTRTSARWTSRVAYRKTGRVIPPCHHWSWSSTYVASDHLTTRSVSVLAPGRSAAGQVELGREVRILPDPDLLAVEADDQDALGGPDVEHDPPIGPVGRHLEFALVDAGRVRLGDLGRKALERHLDVGVVRQVRGAGHRPDARDVGLAPVGAGVGVGCRQELEAPAAVERESLPVGDAVHGESADPRHLGVVPRSGHKNDCGTLRQTGQRDHARPRDAPRDRPGPPIRTSCGRSAGWTSRCHGARSSACSDPTARARPRPSGC